MTNNSCFDMRQNFFLQVIVRIFMETIPWISTTTQKKNIRKENLMPKLFRFYKFIFGDKETSEGIFFLVN